MMEQNINLEDFRSYVLQFNDATEEGFNTYDESFLEALLIHVDRKLEEGFNIYEESFLEALLIYVDRKLKK